MEIGHAIKCAVTGMPALIFGGKPACRAGDERLARNQFELSHAGSFPFESAAFENGSPIPSRYSSGEGENISPPLRWSGVPEGTRSLALIVEDPDAPTPNPFVHWIMYNIPPNVSSIPEGIPHEEIAIVIPGAMQGKNSAMKLGWTGMAPPKGDLPHHYHFQLFALNSGVPLEAEAGRSALFKEMQDHILAVGELVGTYQR